MNQAVPPSHVTPASFLLCFSHLRWDFVVQRPHHILRRAAKSYRVVYLEEPRYEERSRAELRLVRDPSGVTVATPILPLGTDQAASLQRGMVDDLVHGAAGEGLVTWYYTPMALAFTAHLQPDLCVYDCMDELSAFKNPPEKLVAYEELLFRRADIVFTGGRSLYEAKSAKHPNVHCFPSSIDFDHFHAARLGTEDPADQAGIPFPRVGFFGVIDERMDLGLVASTASAMPDVQFVMIGPTAKIDPADLPRRDNLHWLGPKTYAELPRYLGNWQAGWMPFALNDATRFISPTKTPEFLAAGLPLTSTDVKDVSRTYGAAGVVAIAGPDTIEAAIRKTLQPRPEGWQARVDALLGETSWSRTWSAMHRHMVRTQVMRARIMAAVGSLSADVTLPRVGA